MSDFDPSLATIDQFPDDPPPPAKAPESPVPKPIVPELPRKVSVGIVVFSYDGLMRCEIAAWAVDAIAALRAHPRVEHAIFTFCTGYGAERVRNKALADGLDAKIDYMLMVDNDTIPDWHVNETDQKPFFPAALDFMLSHDGPSLVGAPYCAGPPEERVLVSRFSGTENEHLDGAVRGVVLENFTRAESAERRGIELVSSLPTGCLMVDMRVCGILSPPWFSYEYSDPRRTQFASTEDTVFTRNLFYLGVPIYCAWQSWACHVKDKHVGRPRQYPQAAVPMSVRKAWEKAAARQ